MPRFTASWKRTVLAVGLAGAGLSALTAAEPPASPASPAPNAPNAPNAGPVPSLAAAVQTRAAALRDDALRGTRAYDITRSLVTEVGPRPAGSKGDAAAVAWGLRTMKELGFANVHTEKVMVPYWVRGAESGQILGPFPQPVALTALGGSTGTPDEGIEGEVIELPDLAALDTVDPAKIRGKIVFFNTRMERTRGEEGYEHAVSVRGFGPVRAGHLGALAVLIRSIGTDHNRLPHTGGTRYEDGEGTARTPAPMWARIPAAALSAPDADLLADEIATGKPVTFRLKLGSRQLADAESANVIGEIVGRERPEEVVLLACHLDSWDLGRGAIDDGAGCGIMMETARRIGALPVKPRRTIRVVLYANEEFGISGARAYGEAHEAEFARHVLAGESDLGADRVWRLKSRVDPRALPFIGQLVSLLAPLGVEQGNNNASSGGADLIPLEAGHVPVIELNQDASRYFDWHHTANDTLDKLDPKQMDQNVAAWLVVAYAAAETPDTFGPAPDYVEEP